MKFRKKQLLFTYYSYRAREYRYRFKDAFCPNDGDDFLMSLDMYNWNRKFYSEEPNLSDRNRAYPIRFSKYSK